MAVLKEKQEVRARGMLWVAAGASLWGTDTVLRRPLTAALTSLQIVLAEHLILSAVLLPAAWGSRRQWRALRLSDWLAVLAIAWGGSALATVLFTEAVRSGNPTAAILLQKIQPVFAALLAHALLGERLDRLFWLYLGLALAGAYLVSFGAALPRAALTYARAMPALLALAAAALWGSSTVLGRFVLRRLSFSALTAMRILLAAPVLLLATRLPGLDARQLLSIALLALVPGLAALLLYYRGLRQTRASMAAIAELSFPAAATLLNWFFLDARISAGQVAGFALLWSVILKLSGRPR